jgi:hypothetical protein
LPHTWSVSAVRMYIKVADRLCDYRIYSHFLVLYSSVQNSKVSAQGTNFNQF